MFGHGISRAFFKWLSAPYWFDMPPHWQTRHVCAKPPRRLSLIANRPSVVLRIGNVGARLRWKRRRFVQGLRRAT